MIGFQNIFDAALVAPSHHAPCDPIYRMCDGVAANAATVFQDSSRHLFGPFGRIAMPYFKMGNIDSLDLFGMDELIIFTFYHANRERYGRAVDFGANIGLHSIIMSRCGWEVRSFEPDPVHLEQMKSNFLLNGSAAEIYPAAVSLGDGTIEFVRVCGNTTGSHIKGAKSPYGETQTFTVNTEAALPHLAWADLAKIDIEGHEAELLTGMPRDIWLSTDAIVEVGSAENTERIFDYFNGSSINLFAQKIGWARVAHLHDMPTSHHDGSLFLSAKEQMPWSK